MTAFALPRPGVPSGGIRKALQAGIALLAVAFVNGGTALLTNRITQAGTAPKNAGWGTSATAPLVTDTALGTEVAPTTAGGRTVGTESRVTTTVANDTYQVVALITATLAGPTAIVEAGLFDAVSAGNMLMRGTHGAYNVVAADTITYTFKLAMVANVI